MFLFLFPELELGLDKEKNIPYLQLHLDDSGSE